LVKTHWFASNDVTQSRVRVLTKRRLIAPADFRLPAKLARLRKLERPAFAAIAMPCCAGGALTITGSCRGSVDGTRGGVAHLLGLRDKAGIGNRMNCALQTILQHRDSLIRSAKSQQALRNIALTLERVGMIGAELGSPKRIRIFP
jgi:hypothetical protein